MSRIRTIKPEMFDDRAVALLSSDAFRVWMMLITRADDHGLVRADAGWVQGQVYHQRAPDQPVTESLEELDALVQFYEVGGERFGRIRGWTKHQRVEFAGAPRHPLPEGWTASQSDKAWGGRTRKVWSVSHTQRPDGGGYAPAPTSNVLAGNGAAPTPTNELLAGASSDLAGNGAAGSPITDHRPHTTDPDQAGAAPGVGGAGGSVSMDETEIQSRLLSSPAFRGVDVVGAAASIAQHCALKGIRHPRIMQVLPWALSQLEDAMMRPDPPKNPATYVRAIVLRYGPPGCYERRDDGQRGRAPPVSAATAQTGGKLPVYEAAPGLSADEKRAQAERLREAMQRIGKGGTAA